MVNGSCLLLLLLGKYFYVMEAVKTLDLLTLGIFAGGALLGITSFSRVLSYALKHVRNLTLALLTGFMLGSLNKVWPWKEVGENLHGMVVETNVLPNEHVVPAVALMLVGFLLVYVLEKISGRKAEK